MSSRPCPKENGVHNYRCPYPEPQCSWTCIDSLDDEARDLKEDDDE